MHKSGGWLLNTLALFCVVSSVACSGGAGAQGALPDDTSGGYQPDDPTATPENDLSTMLIGTWLGNLGVAQWKTRISLSADRQYQSAFLDPTTPVDDFGQWSVSGATDLPDWDTPWVLTLRSEQHDWVSSYVIVLIDDAVFTERKWSEGSDRLIEMKRVQE